MSLLTYEVYYNSDTAEGSTQTEVNKSDETNLPVWTEFTWHRMTLGRWYSELSFSRSSPRSHCPPSVTTAPGWSRRWPSSRSARCSSAACAPWPPLICWRWPQTLRAATSCRPSSPPPVTKEEARSLRDWRYEYSPWQTLYSDQLFAFFDKVCFDVFLVSDNKICYSYMQDEEKVWDISTDIDCLRK